MKSIIINNKLFRYSIARQDGIINKIIVWDQSGKRHELLAILGHETTTWRGKHGDAIWGKKEVAEIILSCILK